jgi:hypothetical protein
MEALMDMNKIQHKIEYAQDAAGYTVSAGLVSTPIWLQTLTGWLEPMAIIIGIGVGLSTIYLNWKRSKKLDEKRD